MFASRAGNADAILARFPGPVTLAISRLKWLTVLATGAAFVGVCVWMSLAGPDDWGRSAQWTVAFPGLIFFGAVMSLIDAGSLTLDADGFEARSWFRSVRMPWRQVSEFEVGTYSAPGRRRRTVIYDNAKRTSVSATSVREVLGRNSALPETYGLSHEGLARLMTQWRARALDGHSQ